VPSHLRLKDEKEIVLKVHSHLRSRQKQNENVIILSLRNMSSMPQQCKVFHTPHSNYRERRAVCSIKIVFSIVRNMNTNFAILF
jgi:hypothetical protein